RRERLVELDQVDVGQAHPCPFERLGNCLHGGYAHDVGFYARGGEGDESGDRLQTEGRSAFTAHQQERGGSVRVRRRVPGRNRTIYLEGGTQLREPFQRSVRSDQLVLTEEVLLHRSPRTLPAVDLDGDRHDLSLESSLVPCLSR